MPHKHYEGMVIETAISDREEKGKRSISSCPADESTIWQWVKQFKERGACAVGWLLSKLIALYDKHISILALKNKELLKQLARLVEEFPIVGTGGIIGNANVILTMYNCGFL